MSMLRKQKSLWLCTEKCIDNLSLEYNQRLLQDRLAPPGEGENKFNWVPDTEFEV